MKNLSKIFIAITAVLVAFSCATDMTEDLGVTLTGQTTISLSLEGTRTQLGEKAGELYPVYWSQGDQILVNGNTSAALGSAYAGKSNAEFVFATEVERPYNIVYPAVEGVTAVTEGFHPVVFSAEQEYTAGTFASGVAPMYGYAAAPAEGEEPEAVKMKHLTGVLCIAVKGEASIAKIEVSSEKTGIAGNFEVNCETGELKALAETANSVVLDCGAGVALNANEAVPFYVALPAGEYGLFTITLTSTNNEVMVARFNSDNHPIVAGKVKEFKAITFVADAEASAGFEGDVVISTAAELCSFARYSEVVALDKVTSVTIGANIDLSTVATTWSPIQNFPAITFDGGNYEIKGLTAPLIATATGAIIKNVKLTGVNITENNRLYVGSIACDISTSTISNCSAEGALVYNNDIELVGGSNTSYAIGGLVGHAASSTLSDLTNKVAITISKYATKSVKADGASQAIYCGVGGIVGLSHGTSSATCSISNCTNLANIVSQSKNATGIQPTLSGIAGTSYHTSFSNVTNGAENQDCGNITVTKAVTCSAIGAIFGAGKNNSITTATNYGNITHNESIGFPYIGGIIGNWFANDGDTVYTLQSVTNNGNITVPNINNNNGTPYFGGIIGRHAGDKYTLTLKDCTNNGNIELLANYAIINANSAYLGGIIGGAGYVKFDNCDNNGRIKQHGTLNSNKPTWKPKSGNTKGAFTHTSYLYAGGIVGKANQSHISNCDNNGPIDIDTDVIYGHIGGIGGATASKTFTNNHNLANGDITVAGIFKLNVGICGMTSSMGCAAVNCSNAGDIIVSASEPQGDTYTKDDGKSATATGSIYINGIVWTGNYAHSNFTNSGNIKFTGNCYTNVFISGAVYTPSTTITNVHNTGDIEVDVKDLNCPLKVGGICRSSSTAVFSSCSNSGDIVFKGSSKSSVYLGGLCGDVSDAMTTTGDGFVNSGAIKFLGSASSSTTYMGGIAGAATATIGAITTLKNTGLITNYDATNNLIGTGKTIRWGGCFGSVSSNVQNAAVVNVGSIDTRYISTMGADIAIGGIAGNTAKVISNAQCVCDIKAIGFVESAEAPIVGVGIITGAHRGTSALVSKCKLSGRVAWTEENGQPVWTNYRDGGRFIEDLEEYEDPYLWSDKIYGGTTAWTSTDRDGCEYLKTIK